ncbi:hypothetical protein PYW08_011488 [Mythimna loreyi]|uniref:Uncharacterized protein n=1 Tax=Mythimna loreyi TaxID=667449 RepID=A0ACC2QJH3_9NEOP|nr:hypothetical protein PYW08_011488 [Mythimna loreyi]
MCFALPKITYLMRTTPTWLCPEEVSSFDNALKLVVQSVLKVSLDGPQWRQAALPIRCGGLGVRCARDVGLPAFLASAHGVANLVTVLLGTNGDGGSMPFVSDAVSAWLSLSSDAAIPESKHVQRAWDDIGVKLLQEHLLGDVVRCVRMVWVDVPARSENTRTMGSELLHQLEWKSILTPVHRSYWVTSVVPRKRRRCEEYEEAFSKVKQQLASSEELMHHSPDSRSW